MAISTCSLSAAIFPICNASNPKISVVSLPPNSAKPITFRPSKISSNSRLFAAPQVMEIQETNFQAEADGTKVLSVGADSEKMAPKQKIRIKLRSYWVPLIEDSCKQILDAAKNSNAKTMGPVPLPTKKRIYCVLKSPHVHKDARFHFEIRTHQRLIDILYPTAQTIDSLMQLDLPAGVDVEVKL
ncbi:ribosomal protein [Lithospermum erythrorhizon]|uniref:Small ribosomal subunit protein uS10c n=1 Tax=Lithospermum erythrorhizon TaxID=34254 RepID=A0AAV3P1H4_LITER